ncbi:hypothetical protein E1287_13550 [Actinomadura sp. KC06]|uniref:hypothetical protein n=1 Tax=Actinomadura sp. KC06 TaxID=2530369 RepID=UPI00104C1AE4|nr:hypothetical protein [Actinomadura sp. KC06]TDD35501.1 hypothetical protein E1287_13550 [Actinomadura sp. KC06]
MDATTCPSGAELTASPRTFPPGGAGSSRSRTAITTLRDVRRPERAEAGQADHLGTKVFAARRGACQVQVSKMFARLFGHRAEPISTGPEIDHRHVCVLCVDMDGARRTSANQGEHPRSIARSRTAGIFLTQSGTGMVLVTSPSSG